MSAKRENLLGKKFGNLTVIAESEPRLRISGTKTHYWLCICTCGTQKEIQAQKLKNGQSSCGCIRKNKLSFGEAFLNKLFYNYKKDAKKREFCFNLTKSKFLQLVKRECFYCGESPTVRQKTQNFNGIVPVNGIDRIDPTVGYTIANVVSCCPTCNVAKSDMTLQEFKAWVRRVYSLFGRM